MYQELRFAVLALAVAMSTAQAQEQEGKFIIGPRDFSLGLLRPTRVVTD